MTTRRYDPTRHHRRSIRLPNYDYTRAGAYFVTIVTHRRECLFGEIVGDEMRMNDFGKIVAEEWEKTATVRANVILHPDEFVVMPNHIHGIVWIVDDGGETVGATGRENVGATVVGAQRRCAPTRPTNVIPGSLGAIVRGFKSIVTKRINRRRNTPGAPVWQRNYYEHIIRNDESLRRIREYIAQNPTRWALDTENLQATGRHR